MTVNQQCSRWSLGRCISSIQGDAIRHLCLSPIVGGHWKKGSQIIIPKKRVTFSQKNELPGCKDFIEGPKKIWAPTFSKVQHFAFFSVRESSCWFDGVFGAFEIATWTSEVWKLCMRAVNLPKSSNSCSGTGWWWMIWSFHLHFHSTIMFNKHRQKSHNTIEPYLSMRFFADQCCMV